MAHVGKPFPHAIHYDVWKYFQTPAHRLAKAFICTWRINNSGEGACHNTSRSTASNDVEYQYTDNLCRWTWISPCPNNWTFDLELRYMEKLEDIVWRWSLYRNGVLMNRTANIPWVASYESPPTPGSPLWVNTTPPAPSVSFNVGPHAKPWPP